MTVASLWKALQRAGCGKRVGAKELQDHHHEKAKTNPWNVNELEKLSSPLENGPVLAVDLSIWICEALTSSAMQHNHVTDPALQLVYSRTLKLLNLGIGLVIVIEGKRRIRNLGRSRTSATDKDNVKNDGEDKFRKRRSGARFWTACQRCEEMLKLLGTPVVRANAEGEALCALLNKKGIVDGVISNDGDCLLFGAKVLYTKFSVENLDQSNIIRYDANNIQAVVDDDDTDKYDSTREKSKDGKDVVKLSRSDLIAFAILTGSDLAGGGLSKIGCRKAIRFIRKCQIDNPLKEDTNSSPVLKLLLSWEQNAIGASEDDNKKEISGPHCSCCGHPGTKKSHKRYGCKGCGTKPGELCFKISSGDRFRKSLRSRALEMRPDFHPSSTIRAYHEPNENQIPLCLIGKTARTVKMKVPQLEKMLQSSFIVRGRSHEENQEYIRKSLSTYLARQELFGQMMSKSASKEDRIIKLPTNSNRPVPIGINKLLVRAGKPSCEVKWVVKATTSDVEGNPLDRYEFSTIEDKGAIQKCYPKLIRVFEEEQKALQQQGAAEQEKRRAFLLNMEEAMAHRCVGPLLETSKKDRARQDCFDKYQCVVNNACNTKSKGVSDDVKAILVQIKNNKQLRKEENSGNRKYDLHIGKIIATNADGGFKELKPHQRGLRRGVRDAIAMNGTTDENEECMDCDSSTIMTINLTEYDIGNKPKTFRDNDMPDHCCNALTPGHLHYLGVRSTKFRYMTGSEHHFKNETQKLSKSSTLPIFLDAVDQTSKHPVSKETRPGKKNAVATHRNFAPTSVADIPRSYSKDAIRAEYHCSDRTNKRKEISHEKRSISTESEIEKSRLKVHQDSTVHEQKRSLSRSPQLKRAKGTLDQNEGIDDALYRPSQERQRSLSWSLPLKRPKTMLDQNECIGGEVSRLDHRAENGILNSYRHSEEGDRLFRIEVLKTKIKLLELEHDELEERKKRTWPRSEALRVVGDDNGTDHFEIPSILPVRHGKEECHRQRPGLRRIFVDERRRQGSSSIAPAPLLDKSSEWFPQRPEALDLDGCQEFEWCGGLRKSHGWHVYYSHEYTERQARDDQLHCLRAIDERDDFRFGHATNEDCNPNPEPIGRPAFHTNRKGSLFDSHCCVRDRTGSRGGDGPHRGTRRTGTEKASPHRVPCPRATNPRAREFEVEVELELEERVASKLESRTRRAKLGLLCSEGLCLAGGEGDAATARVGWYS